MTNTKINERIKEMPLEEVMGERFGRYSKYIIQERALPDIRDGLKPVQRRILYAMYKDGNTFDKAYKKAAKAVGNVMGNFHPHGDSSIYGALVHLSQDWKMRQTLIEMHGNNGSMDGDGPAAMRYTESRLSKISNLLLKDIDKDTVQMVLNFDDTEYEPTVLPAHFPNLLVNGSTGISAGYATEIPPHNLSEVLDALIYLIKHPDAKIDELMTYIKGPDFPTGGLIIGNQGIKDAYETGRGRIQVRAKTKIKVTKGQKPQIVITEIPFGVNKAMLVKKIDEIRLNKDVDGITEVRDETDRHGLSIVIELKKEVDSENILNYLFKSTDLQISYNFNMVAIDHMAPVQLGLKRILSSYLEHKKSVVLKRTHFDLVKSKQRLEIVEGLIYALNILDQVIKTIRASKDKKDAKVNLMNNYSFTEKQAEAIVSLQLYRLTNTDVNQLLSEKKQLEANILDYLDIINNKNRLEAIVSLQLYRLTNTDVNQLLSEKKQLEANILDYLDIINNKNRLEAVIVKEFEDVKKEFGSARRTQIVEQYKKIEIDEKALLSEEDVRVLVSANGYLKRSSLRSYQSTDSADNGLPSGDEVIFDKTVSTLSNLYIFTNKGNLIYRPVYELVDTKWRETGQHLSQEIVLTNDERIISVFDINNLNSDLTFLITTNDGYIKQVALSDLQPTRTYKSRAIMVIKLKDDHSNVLMVEQLKSGSDNEILLVTNSAYALRFDVNEVPLVGPRAAGVKSINLKNDDDYVVSAITFDPECLNSLKLGIVTQRGAFKQLQVDLVNKFTRAKRGSMILRELKTKPHRIVAALIYTQNHDINIKTSSDRTIKIRTNDYPVGDRYSNGSFVVDTISDGVPVALKLGMPLAEELGHDVSDLFD